MTRLEEVQAEVAGHMDSILKNFKQPAEITVLVRQPDFPDGSRDFMMTDDDLDEAIKAIGRRKPS
jgi:hypothetical protein